MIHGKKKELLNGAFRISQGKIVKAVAVTPFTIDNGNGKDAEINLDSLFEPFKGIGVQLYGAAASLLFSGLGYVSSIDSGDLKKKQEEKCPHFSIKSVDGSVLSPFTFKGKPFVVFTGKYRNAMSSELQRILYDLLPSKEEKIGFIEVFEDPQWFSNLEQLRLGAEFRGRLAADSQRSVAQVLSIPYAPYVLGFDKNHTLIVATPFKGRVGTVQAMKKYFAGCLK